jgi:shikimate dehydrogenase
MKKLFAVIGDPIAHSMSPDIHNDAFTRLGMEAHYQAFQIKSDQLEATLDAFKLLNVEGFNVTIPHKTKVLPLLDRIDPLAKAIGAVNTVKRENGSWIGYNTDGLGFLQSLKEANAGELKNKQVLIIGAGGAARAIYFTLAQQGIKKIDLTNRSITKAEQLKKDCPFKVETKSLSLVKAESLLARYDIVIQCTSIGMAPNIIDSPIQVSLMKKDCLAMDIVYNPLKTMFLQKVEKQGAQIQNGVGMFIHQAAIAFEIWTGTAPDTNKMNECVLQKLGGNHVNR